MISGVKIKNYGLLFREHGNSPKFITSFLVRNINCPFEFFRRDREKDLKSIGLARYSSGFFVYIEAKSTLLSARLFTASTITPLRTTYRASVPKF